MLGTTKEVLDELKVSYLEDPITEAPVTRFRVKPGGLHRWTFDAPVLKRKHREAVTDSRGMPKIVQGKVRAGSERHEVTGYIVEGYDPTVAKWIWFDTEDNLTNAKGKVSHLRKRLVERANKRRRTP